MADYREQWQYWVAVAALPRVSPATLCQCWQQGWTAPRLLAADDGTLAALGFKPAVRSAIKAWQLNQGPLQQRVNQVADWRALNPALHHVVPWDSEFYPRLLQQIPDPPAFLLVYGNPAILCLPQIGIVGSRHATRQGLRNAAAFARELARSGLVVTSGLALGIDGAAHQAVVDQHSATLAVLGTGPDVAYPARHQRLAGQIIETGGALVTEFWPGTPPRGGHFPRRNRIISGLSAGVLVIEAAPRSGSLITARLALDYNREVFALPGALHSPQSQGCHTLIREGATLVQTTAHIMEQLGSILGAQCEVQAVEMVADSADLPLVLTPAEQSLLRVFEAEQLSLDQLCALMGQGVTALLPQLTALELKGLVERAGMGYQRIG